MIDRERIEAAWNRIAHTLDPLHADAEADALLRNREVEASGIADALRHIDLIDRTSGGAVGELGYGFVREAGIWRRANEAVFQARVLQQLTRWATLSPDDCNLLSGVVVRHTFATGFAFGTPQHIPADDIHFVVVPFAYLELLMLSAKTLNAAIAGSEEGDAWAPLEGATKVHWPAVAPGPLKQLIARILTDHAFHAAVPGENPTDALKQAFGWFDYSDGNRSAGKLETHVSYSALDFALAHELGHRMIHSAATKATGGLELEILADTTGFHLFAASWGWRDDILEDAPIGLAGRVLLGPIWFFFSAALLFTLRSLLGQRMQSVVPHSSAAFDLSKPNEHVALINQRWGEQKHVLDQYASALEETGGDITDEDQRVLARLCDEASAFTDALPEYVRGIPDEAIAFAANLARI